MSHRKAAAPHITTQTGGEETETMPRETGTERYMEEGEETEDGRKKRKREERVKDICWKRGWRRKRSKRREDRGGNGVREQRTQKKRPKDRVGEQSRSTENDKKEDRRARNKQDK